MSSNAALCAGCHGIIGGTSFVENGQAFHFGCRPRQQQHDFPTQSDIEHGDLLARIAALEDEALDKEEALRWVYRTHILNGMTYEEWYSQTLKRASEWIEPGDEAGDDSSR